MDNFEIVGQILAIMASLLAIRAELKKMVVGKKKWYMWIHLSQEQSTLNS